jgi:hypothetical protein
VELPRKLPANRAAMLNQVATVSKKETIVFHTKLEIIWCRIRGICSEGEETVCSMASTYGGRMSESKNGRLTNASNAIKGKNGDYLRPTFRM